MEVVVDLRKSCFVWALSLLLPEVVVLQVSCHDPVANFVFGDSLVEVGNNNYIWSLSRADHPPNGIDFGGPTGRFTNGRTIVDIVGEKIGLKEWTPPYMAPTTRGSVILQGVNYGSGSSGILNETGKILIGRMNMDAQLDNFANTRQDMIGMIGEDAAMELLRNALFSVTMGSNDFLQNYLVPVVSTYSRANVGSSSSFRGFYDIHISTATNEQRLYEMGARKIVVANVGPIGCIPYERDLNPSAGDNCVAFPNQLAYAYNLKLKSLLMHLNAALPGSRFLYADVYRIFSDIIQNYSSYGFECADSACCSLAGRFGGLVTCGASSRVCTDRSKYVFWDAYHPSDATNAIIADRLMDGDPSHISPINVRQLLSSTF